MAALADYVDFGALGSELADSGEPCDELRRSAGEQPSDRFPRKGMLAQDVDARIGAAANTRDRKEGALRVETREYATGDGRITAEFVEGVLIRYTVRSE
jgi:hypothetical protein